MSNYEVMCITEYLHIHEAQIADLLSNGWELLSHITFEAKDCNGDMCRYERMYFKRLVDEDGCC